MKIVIYDGLIGLVNRILLLDRLEYVIGFVCYYEYCVVVMFVDLDRFKGINDLFGYDYGDKLLCIVVNWMWNFVVELGIVVWLGGDEFVIVIEEVNVNDDLSLFVV